MSNRARSGSIPTELPPCDGPKLQLFEYHESPIEWLERLDTNRDTDAATEGYVFRARIRGRLYAIKVFKFFDPILSKDYWGPLIGRDTDLREVAYYTDPFFAECRAYGRIRHLVGKKKIKPTIAIHCYGWLFLKERDERNLRKFNLNFDLDQTDLLFQQSTIGGCRIRAIVKDIASTEHGISQSNLGKILSGIKSLNRNKIYNLDIRLDNYRDGQMVDFGSSWTEPHDILNALDDRAARGSRITDRVLFDQMVRDEAIPNPKGLRAMPDTKYLKKLRPRK